jgi:phosphopantothenoylcysteine decarboxylase/phosphopantothenate--cysteine ligase
VDAVRLLTNKFTGRLGILIADELYLRGADALLIHAGGVAQPPTYLPHRAVATYDQYLEQVMAALAEKVHRAAIFSAAVADYRPEEMLPGKTPSGSQMSIRLVPTRKVIAEVRKAFPRLHMVTFKYQEGVSHQELMSIARQRLAEGYEAVVANRGEEKGAGGAQVAYLVSPEDEIRLVGKEAIARGIADYLEAGLSANR